jgi:hypothetical protein
VLKGVNLTVHEAELVAVVGASGIGKSTLLHVLGALDRPTAGSVWFRGEDLFARSEAELTRFRREEVGFVFQLYNLLTDFSALENAMLPALIQRRPPEEARRLAVDALREVGLLERAGHRPAPRRELSPGAHWSSASRYRPTHSLDPKTSETLRAVRARPSHRHPQPRRNRADRLDRLVDGRAIVADVSPRGSRGLAGPNIRHGRTPPRLRGSRHRARRAHIRRAHHAAP